MSKVKLAVEQWEQEHRRHVEEFLTGIDDLYDSATADLVRLGVAYDYDPDSGRPFAFSREKGRQKSKNEIISTFREKMKGIISAGVAAEWAFANDKTDSWVKQLFTDPKRGYMARNLEALSAYQHRKVYGHTLSERVWDVAKQFERHIELSLSVGIAEGRSAANISRDVRVYLNEPDKLFRRVQDQFGELVPSKAAKAYHPGQGVYRSSYQNAMRMARTEINGAYREADYTRWQQLDFIVGYEVKVSKAHEAWLAKFWRPRFKKGRVPEEICDTMKGRYPKDFKFIGWHPNCRCYAIPILANEGTDRDWWEEPINEVTEPPAKYKEWLTTNADRIERANARGTLPYWITENRKYTGVLPRMGENGKTMTGTKLGRSAAKEAFKEYEDGKPTVLTKEQQAQTIRIAKDMGLGKPQPMTFFEADKGRANVNFGKGIEYSENCQCCVALHEARLRGLDLTAIGYSGSAGSITKRLGDSFQDIWINAKTGKIPQITTLRAGTEEALFDKLNKSTAANGRYHIGINFRDNTGHIITAERLESGKLLFYDAQSGNFLNIKEFTTLESFEVLKVDKLLFNEEMLRYISQII